MPPSQEVWNSRRDFTPVWVGHFLRDGLTSLSDCEHPIEIARPSIKTMQLAYEAKLFDWIEPGF
jgi:hypothetical protein